MTLYKMSFAYGESARLLHGRLIELRQRRRGETDPEMRRCLALRIATLRPLLREMRELQQLTANYYDRRWQRDEALTIQQ